jgi:hypothetical protein
MKRWASIGLVLLVALTLIAVVSTASTSLLGTRFKLGEEIQFKVEDSTVWWWGCCSCTASSVLGWRVVSGAGQTVYSVVHDAPVPASIWSGAWEQTASGGVAVAAGQYILYVDTTAGTLSRCFSLYDPCGCNSCYSPCTSCVCNEVPSITDCACKTTLVFVDTCGGCFPFFWWLGCSSCSGCSSCP